MPEEILLITPPFTQLNTPYPATAYLKGFLNTRGISSVQADLGLEVILSIYSFHGLQFFFERIAQGGYSLSRNARQIWELRQEYLRTIESVMAFLQGREQTLAYHISNGDYLPCASRFRNADDLEWAFGVLGTRDKARHLCTLYLEDLSDLIRETVDPHFGFSRYAETLGRSASSFDRLHRVLQEKESFTDELMWPVLENYLQKYRPRLVGITVPFPGNLYSALRCGEYIRTHYPDIKVALGGGYVNTELRSLSDARIFDYMDFILLDAGELPLFRLMKYVKGEASGEQLLRTYRRENGKVRYDRGDGSQIAQADTGTPDYEGLLLDRYLSVIEMPNPMHRLWSDGRWNKLTLAYGCYWGRCAFCDGSLDYIGRYDPNTATDIADRIEALIRQTGERGFHFVDEAAPPALLRDVALEILKRGLTVVWWTNVRFEKSFTADLCRLLRRAGCIAVSGGLEVASDRLLKLINKGVTVKQVARVTRHFTEAGIMVHAYLMYGFPSETDQETIDSLETVRQLFENGLIQSAFWHRFALTAHSPVGLHPERYAVRITEPPFGGFARNDIAFEEADDGRHERFGSGLDKALFNYMHGICLDAPLQSWFHLKVPPTRIAPDYIEFLLQEDAIADIRPDQQLIWIGTTGEIRQSVKTGNKSSGSKEEMELLTGTGALRIRLSVGEGEWLKKRLNFISPVSGKKYTLKELKQDYERYFNRDFSRWWKTELESNLRKAGLLAV